MASNFAHLLRSALARRLAYLIVAAGLALLGFGGNARAQSAPPDFSQCFNASAYYYPEWCETRADAYSAAKAASLAKASGEGYQAPYTFLEYRVTGTTVTAVHTARSGHEIYGQRRWYIECPGTGSSWNSETNTCDVPCSDRPSLGPSSYQSSAADSTICMGSCTFKGTGSCLGVFLDGSEYMACDGWQPTGATCSIGDSPSAPSDSDGDGTSDGSDGSPNNPGQGGSGQGGAPGQDGSGNPSGGSGSGPGGGQGNGPGEGSGNGNTSGGGGNCSTPPASTGDAILAQIAFQTWATRCAVEKQGKKGEGDEGDKDNSEVPFNEGEEAEDDGEDPGEVPSHSFDLPSMIDMTGFLGGGGSCPDFGSITMGPFGTHSLGGQWFCDWLPVFRALIILMATGTAIKILLGYNA